MSRNNRRRRSTSQASAFSPTLDHTASRYPRRLSDYQPVSLADIREAFSLVSDDSQVRPLIRTVLPEPAPFRKMRQSPTRPVRATFRSSDRATRSPFLNATTVTPQLTERALECASRTIRKEVLFAKRKTGKGSRAPRRNRSKVKC